MGPAVRNSSVSGEKRDYLPARNAPKPDLASIWQ
jgi:hypothetical protein